MALALTGSIATENPVNPAFGYVQLQGLNHSEF